MLSGEQVDALLSAIGGEESSVDVEASLSTAEALSPTISLPGDVPIATGVALTDALFDLLTEVPSRSKYE